MSPAFHITATSSLTPYGIGAQAYLHGSQLGKPSTQDIAGSYTVRPQMAVVPDYDAQKLLAVRSVSNFDRLTLHVCVAVDQLHQQLGFNDLALRREKLADDRMGIVLGCAGPLQSIVDFDLQTIEEPSYVQPSKVPNLVFNVPASYAAIRHGIRGSCITLTDGDSSSLKAFAVAAGQLEFGRIDLAMVGGAEEATPAYAMFRQAMDKSELERELPIAEGAALFALETAQHAKAAGRQSLAGLYGCVQLFSPQDRQAGLNACVEKLRRQHPSAMREIEVVYCDSECDLTQLQLLTSAPVRLNDRLGRAGAMYGSLALLDALTSPTVAEGTHLLILQADEAGTCVAGLFQKRAQLN